MWLLGPGVEPHPHALEHLLAVAEGAGELPRPPLLTSRPVDGRGGLVEAALPRGDEAGTERLLASVRHGLVPIRQAPLTSLLVDAAAARAVAAPDPDRFGAFAVRAWTGRLLAEEPGYLVLASRVRVPPPPRPAFSALPALARVAARAAADPRGGGPDRRPDPAARERRRPRPRAGAAEHAAAAVRVGRGPLDRA